MHTHISEKLLVLLLALAVAACGGEADAGLDAETAETLDQIEAEVTRLGEEIDASDMRDDLETAWDGVEEEVTEAVDAIRSGETIDSDAIEQQLEQFEQTVESVDVEQSMRDAWTELRANIEDLLADMG